MPEIPHGARIDCQWFVDDLGLEGMIGGNHTSNTEAAALLGVSDAAGTAIARRGWPGGEKVRGDPSPDGDRREMGSGMGWVGWFGGPVVDRWVV